ncbi:MAG: YhcH/YjgK/YiaL family protein [Terrimicrobiaceae bacterium]
MILDTLQNSRPYESLHPRFGAAFKHLRELAARDDLPDGRIECDGESLFALVSRGTGKTMDKVRNETHRRYIDIQFIKHGSDRIGWMPVTDCRHPQGYNEEKDVEFYTDTPPAWIEVGAGQFAIFFPSDAHAPMANTGRDLTKIVIKVEG